MIWVLLFVGSWVLAGWAASVLKNADWYVTFNEFEEEEMWWFCFLAGWIGFIAMVGILAETVKDKKNKLKLCPHCKKTIGGK